MNKEYVMEKLALMSTSMRNDAVDKIRSVINMHRAYIRNAEEVIPEIKSLAENGDEAAKLFMFQNYKIVSPEDRINVLGKLYNAKHNLTVDKNSKGWSLGVVEDDIYKAVKEGKMENPIDRSINYFAFKDHIIPGLRVPYSTDDPRYFEAVNANKQKWQEYMNNNKEQNFREGKQAFDDEKDFFDHDIKFEDKINKQEKLSKNIVLGAIATGLGLGAGTGLLKNNKGE